MRNLHTCLLSFPDQLDAVRPVDLGYDDGEYRCFQFKGVCNSDSPTDKMKFQKILEEVNEDIGVKRDRRLHSAYESGESNEIQDTDDIPF